MSNVTDSRWEWRSFGAAFDQLNPILTDSYTAVQDVYVVSSDSGWVIRVADDRLECRVVADERDGLELWRVVTSAAFPVCQREVRDVVRALNLPPPPMFRPQFTPLQFLTEIASCTDGWRVLGVSLLHRHTAVDGCDIERASLAAAGQVVQTAAVTGPQPEPVLRLVRRFGLDLSPNTSVAAFLWGLLAGAPPSISRNLPPRRELFRSPATPPLELGSF